MIAQPFFNEEQIRKFVTQPVIWDKISDDLHSVEKYKPDMDDLWLAVFEGPIIIGMCCFNLINSITVGIHPYFAKRHKGRKGIITCLEWIKNQEFRRIDKVIAVIPLCYKSVYNCARKIGFFEEGISKKSFLKNSIVYDRYYTGLDLSCWEAIKCQK